MIKTVKFKDQVVPEYITLGNHARFILPIAKEICKGSGLDIGCGKIEWSLPGSIPVDPNINKYDAMLLPSTSYYDYIFSSHCLEHIPDYMSVLEYWTSRIKSGGILFLYLPHSDCLYWRPWEMPTKKHLHQFNTFQLKAIFENLGYTNIFYSERDAAYSFSIYGEKK